MDTSLIEAYAAAMTSQPQITELEIIADGIHVRLRRNIAVADATHELPSDLVDHVVEKDAFLRVTAQSVGIFVPTEPAFEVGDIVDGTRSLGAIDTVGITTAIISPVTGVVATVHVVSGQPVEYGQVMFELLESKAN